MKLGDIFVLCWSLCFLAVIFLAPFVALALILKFLFG
jgi:hypothetical protein